MNLLTNKTFSRISIVITSGAFRLISSFSNLLISLVIIHTHSIQLWGELVSFTLFLDLGFSIINWGQIPYLNREFSVHPDRISKNLISSITSRFSILCVFVIGFWLTSYPTEIKIILTIWSLSRFAYQAFDSVTQFERNFKYGLVVEIVALTTILIPIAFSWVDMNPTAILWLYAISYLIRAVSVSIWYRKYVLGNIILSRSSGKNFLLSALPFFLLSVSAMVQQRVDLYIVALFLTPSETAQYQIFLNLLILGQLIASLLISPFSKNIFRLSRPSTMKLQKRFTITGSIITIVYVALCYVVINFIYDFNLPWTMYPMGYLYIVMFYLYLIKNYELGKAYKQTTVAIFSFVGGAVNLILSILFTPRIGIEGAMLAGLTTQLFVVILYQKDQIKKLFYANR